MCVSFSFLYSDTIETHMLTEWRLSCVMGNEWDPQLCNIWRVLRYCFQMKSQPCQVMEMFEMCHTPLEKWTGKKVTTIPVIGNYFAYLEFLPEREVDAFIIFTPCCAYCVKHVCVYVWQGFQQSLSQTKEWQRKWWESRSVSELSE